MTSKAGATAAVKAMSQHLSSIDLIGEIIDSVAELPETDPKLLAKIEAEMRWRFGRRRGLRSQDPGATARNRGSGPAGHPAAAAGRRARLLPAHNLPAAARSPPAGGGASRP